MIVQLASEELGDAVRRGLLWTYRREWSRHAADFYERVDRAPPHVKWKECESYLFVRLPAHACVTCLPDAVNTDCGTAIERPRPTVSQFCRPRGGMYLCQRWDVTVTYSSWHHRHRVNHIKMIVSR